MKAPILSVNKYVPFVKNSKNLNEEWLVSCELRLSRFTTLVTGRTQLYLYCLKSSSILFNFHLSMWAFFLYNCLHWPCLIFWTCSLDKLELATTMIIVPQYRFIFQRNRYAWCLWEVVLLRWSCAQIDGPYSTCITKSHSHHNCGHSLIGANSDFKLPFIIVVFCRKFRKLLADGDTRLRFLKRKMFSPGEEVLVDSLAMAK